VVAVAFSPDGRYLIASQYDSTVCRWQLATDDGTQPCMAWTHDPYHGEAGLHPIAVSPDSRFLVSTNPLSEQQPFTTLDVWLVETVGDTVTPIEQMTGGVLPILGVAFSPTGRYLASAGSDGFVRVFDTQTWHVAQTLGGGLGGGFFHPAFSLDEHNLFAGSSDGTAKLWDLSTGTLLRTFYGHTRYVADAVFPPDGHWVLTASADGTVIVQPLEFQEVVNAVCAQLSHRQFSSDEFALYGLSDTVLACPPSNNAIVPTLPPISTQLLPDFTPLVPHPIYQILPTEIPIPTLSPIILTVNAPATPTIPVWTPLPSPTASYTPTLTSTPVMARAGEQRGEIQRSSAQVWMYAGQAGDAVTIRVNADLPAVNDQVQNESGLDTYVTIYTPDGTILADNDDRSSDPHYTDSYIESVTLPADGLYQIVVSDLLNANAGGYILVVESSRSDKPAPASTPTPTAAP
jgi:WD40 repeat protein